MTKPNDSSFPVFSLVYNIVAIPYNFFIGFILGLAAPIAAIAAVVAGVRFLTGRMPFLSQAQGEEGERYLTLSLVSPDEVSDLFAEQKKTIEGDLGKMQSEIKAIIEEAQAGAAPEEAVELAIED